MHSARKALFVLSVLISAVRAVNVTALFGPHLSPGATIYFPTDPNYDTAVTQRVSTWHDPSYIVAIKPATIQDVQSIVKIANAHNIPYLATGGAHGAEVGLSSVQNAINIDLGNFNTTSVNAATNTLTIGAATIFNDVYQPLYDVGKEVQTGNAPCVNMIGATIGAGVGPLQGLHGLIIDALRSVLLVTPSGDIINASNTQNRDLFWAIRGAGANFGIITAATYEVHNATNSGQVINADFVFNPLSNVSVWEILKSWDSDDVYPQEMGITLVATYDHSTNSSQLIASIAFFGTQEAAQPFLNKFIDLKPLAWENETVPWPQLSQVAGFGRAAAACARGAYSNHFMAGSRNTDVAEYTSIFKDFSAWVKARPWFTGQLVWQRYNSKVTRALPASQQGAYPWRDIRTLVSFDNAYDGPAHDAEVNSFFIPLRQRFYDISGFPSPQIYINYGFGDEGPAAWWGKSLSRLIQLKREYDPHNRFGPLNPIPLY